MRILLVEDNELNRDMLRRRLERAKHEVLTAPDGQEGVRLALEGHPDVILMDLDLPVLNGWQAIEAIRSSPSGAAPIIVLSAYALAETREAALAAGCVDFVTKPIDFAYLLDTLQRHGASR